MQVDLNKALVEMKEQLVEFKATFEDREAAVMKEVDGKLVPISDEITKAGDLIEALEGRVKEIEEAVKAKQSHVPAGLAEEIEENGPVNPLICTPGTPFFDKNSRDWSLIKEHTSKQRDLSVQDDESGGILVPMEALGNEFIDLARARSVVWDAALVSIADGLVGTPVTIPKETGSATIYWVGENEAPTKSDVTFGEIQFTPKKAAARVHISNRLLRMRNGQLANDVVRRNIARGLGIEVDRVALRGSGASGEPLGIANYSGINEVEIGTDGGDFTFDVAADMVYELEKDNTDVGRLAFIGHPGAFHKMRKERIAQFSGDTGGSYVMLPMTEAQIRARLGYDFRRTTTIPSNLTKGTSSSLTEVYFGNWEDLWLAFWSDITFRASDVTGDSTGSALMKDQTWLYAFIEMDVQLARATSMVLVNDAATT